MSSSEYPELHRGGSLLLAWQLRGKRVVLVGGGAVAAGRLVNVLEADAVVTLISPREGLSPEVEHRIFVEKFVDTYHDRPFAGASDLEGADMVLTAIDDNALSEDICRMARERRIPVNIADVPPQCDFYFGSQIRRGPLQVMVSTGGQGPKIANIIRRRIEDALPPAVAQAIERIGALRRELRKRAPGVGGELGQRRMRWMIKVCEDWNLEELAQLDDEAALRVLEGWEKGTVPSYEEVMGGRASVKTLNRVVDSLASLSSVAGPPLLGAIVGVAATWAFLTRR